MGAGVAEDGVVETTPGEGATGGCEADLDEDDAVDGSPAPAEGEAALGWEFAADDDRTGSDDADVAVEVPADVAAEFCGEDSTDAGDVANVFGVAEAPTNACPVEAVDIVRAWPLPGGG